MADKKRDILEFVEQSNFEQFTPTQLFSDLILKVQNESHIENLIWLFYICNYGDKNVSSSLMEKTIVTGPFTLLVDNLFLFDNKENGH